jgi:Rrf2 family iron-sulfur cluster assembly transcriptional regulator
MKLTRGGEYGIRGVLYLAKQEEGKVSMLSAIAKAQDVPPRFLAKIFQALAKAGVVRSHRGAKEIGIAHV